MRTLCALAFSSDLAGVEPLLQVWGGVDGFDVNGFSQESQSNPLQLVAEFDYVSVLETTLEACANGVQKLLEHRVDVNYIDASQSSALAKAVEQANQFICLDQLQRGIILQAQVILGPCCWLFIFWFWVS